MVTPLVKTPLYAFLSEAKVYVCMVCILSFAGNNSRIVVSSHQNMIVDDTSASIGHVSIHHLIL